MKHTITFLLFILFSIPAVFSQDYRQYFDGADTNVYNAILIEFDTAATNIWQIGPPQKTIFNGPASAPNVLITDTINMYPDGNESGFKIKIVNSNPNGWWGIHALQWKQKIDFDSADGGIVEYTLDSGKTWINVFDDPYVYNYTGFDSINLDTLSDGRYAFVGTDTNWKDVWLCFEYSWLANEEDTILIRFNFVSDTAGTPKEGWMIDNILAHRTLFHTINELKQENYIEISPNPTDGRININTRKINDYHIIEEMMLFDMNGRVVKEYGLSPVKFHIDISDLPAGKYFLKIKTNLQTETLPVLLQK